MASLVEVQEAVQEGEYVPPYAGAAGSLLSVDIFNLVHEVNKSLAQLQPSMRCVTYLYYDECASLVSLAAIKQKNTDSFDAV